MDVLKTIDDLKPIVEFLNSTKPFLLGGVKPLKTALSTYRLSKTKSKELTNGLRQLVLEFRRNSRLANEYVSSSPGNQFYSPDDRLTNCSMQWDYLSYNYAEDLEIPIALEDFINCTYDRFKAIPDRSEEYKAISDLFDFLSNYFQDLYEERK